MKAPSSRYGCGDYDCQACYGDKEWQAMKEREWARDVINDPEGYSEDSIHDAESLLEGFSADDLKTERELIKQLEKGKA